MKNKPRYTDKMPFGKYKGTKICDIPVSYLQWTVLNCNFNDENFEENTLRSW
jgi:uncharacterized protein (DUF3820 family)